MHLFIHYRTHFKQLLAAICLLSSISSEALADTDASARVAELEAEIARLTEELSAAKAALSDTNSGDMSVGDVAEAEAAPVSEQIQPGDLFPWLEGLTVGGAIRANYAIGDYGDATGGPSRSFEDGGNFGLDTFRINLDYSRDDWLGKLEYRFYNGYHFLHTGWVGYQLDAQSHVELGVNRVPFGPGAYGVSQSWFFDQHYYVGLADDMDLGVKYHTERGNWRLDFAYYLSDEGQGAGDSRDAARYSYDVINESGNGYEERHQFNLRAIYALEFSGGVTADLGASLQYGLLESRGAQDDGDLFAGSVHAIFKSGNWTLAPQLTYYSYDVDGAQPLGTDDLVQIGAYDFPTLLAAEAWIPAVSLSYYWETPQVGWLDSITPYVEYSSIMKTASGFNDSEMITLGSAWARGGWYIYTDWVFSNGNDFVGTESGFNGAGSLGRVGANLDDEWESRFNINFGYYF